ncbi:MAG: DUF6702 family protein [Bacteroidota bacterium]
MHTVFTYLFALFLMLDLRSEHAVYISVVEITDGRVEVKVFTDDLQNAIRNFDPNMKMAQDDQFCRENRNTIQSYFQRNLKIDINDKPMEFSYASATTEGDSYWIVFDMGKVGTWKTVSVEDRHFMEIFPTQTNIIKIIGGKQRFCKLTIGDPSCSFPM